MKYPITLVRESASSSGNGADLGVPNLSYWSRIRTGKAELCNPVDGVPESQVSCSVDSIRPSESSLASECGRQSATELDVKNAPIHYATEKGRTSQGYTRPLLNGKGRP